MTIPVPAGPRTRGSLDGLLARARIGPCAVFPAGLRFEGSAQLPCNVIVEGNVDGTLDVAGQGILHVANSGAVVGTLNCPDARIDGTVDGEINCPEGAVEISATARCRVKLHYRELSVARGAEVEADFIASGVQHG